MPNRPLDLTTPLERPLNVLVADSDPGIRELLAAIFQRQGWRVTTAADGDTALDLLRGGFPDVLVLDVILAKASGFDVLAWVNTTNRSWLGHVVVLTAAPTKVFAELAKIEAIGHVMRKPFDVEDLVGSVQSCATVASSSEPWRERAAETVN